MDSGIASKLPQTGESGHSMLRRLGYSRCLTRRTSSCQMTCKVVTFQIRARSENSIGQIGEELETLFEILIKSEAA
ncbi:MAG: hypothetical protein DRO05_00070 [Thermoproteota archaeon]|nr:MAG: hypothetical protein DRO05_00070 [Candidatus Korarchaeota archaeon]